MNSLLNCLFVSKGKAVMLILQHFLTTLESKLKVNCNYLIQITLVMLRVDN